jgi:hypothetical protein
MGYSGRRSWASQSFFLIIKSDGLVIYVHIMSGQVVKRSTN